MKKYDYILCDLDGTLLDDSGRHYQCYCDIVKKFGGICVSKEHYWELKRNMVKRTVLLEETDFQGEYEDFAKSWIEWIEQDSYLEYEVAKHKLMECLAELKMQSNHLLLVTMRQNKDALMRQLDRMGITSYFERICSVSPLKEKTKSEVVGPIESNKILVIGDSEADEALAQEKNAQFIGMTDGLREKKFLHADYYCNNLIDLIEFLQRPLS